MPWVKPASRLWRVPGTQMVPADVALVPPTRDDFSHSSTSSPSIALTKAAVMPAAPAPITSVSTSIVSADIIYSHHCFLAERNAAIERKADDAENRDASESKVGLLSR